MTADPVKRPETHGVAQFGHMAWITGRLPLHFYALKTFHSGGDGRIVSHRYRLNPVDVSDRGAALSQAVDDEPDIVDAGFESLPWISNGVGHSLDDLAIKQPNSDRHSFVVFSLSLNRVE